MACAGARESGRQGSRAAQRPAPTVSTVGPELQPDAETVGQVQLYQGDDERQWPILLLGGRDVLTLRFDLLSEQGRPLSIYFYHADYAWRRDLMPIEYLEAFARDDLTDYAPSEHTAIPYQHYVYRFPNDNIRFRLSGNYILRVTEQGQEEAVLFERPFFVVEGRTRVEVSPANFPGAQAFPSVQLMARFRPPDELAGAVFDYVVCFARNGAFEAMRCSRRALLDEQPVLSFLLEEPFPPEPADYLLDLSVLRPGGQIERVERSAVPPEVWLAPDYVRFGGSDTDPLLAGQSVIGAVVRDAPGDPHRTAEYVRVHFRLEPERPWRQPLWLVGSFSGWLRRPSYRMRWDPDRRRYAGEALVKQGWHAYRYVLDGVRSVRANAGALPRSENIYTAFVYYRDASRGSDRLLGIGNQTGQ